MKTLNKIIKGIEGWNENPAVRFVRYSLGVGVLAAVDYGASHVMGVPVPQAWAWTLPEAAVGLAALDKFLRNKYGAK